MKKRTVSLRYALRKIQAYAHASAVLQRYVNTRGTGEDSIYRYLRLRTQQAFREMKDAVERVLLS